MADVKIHKKQLESTDPQYIKDYGFPTKCPTCYHPYYLTETEVEELITTGKVEIQCLKCNKHNVISTY